MTATASVEKIAGGAKIAAERSRSLLTKLNLSYAVVGILALDNVYLLAQMFFTWRAANSEDASALAQQTALMKSAENAKRPLQGLDAKLTSSTTDADSFYGSRLPATYSDVLAELGALTKKQGVKLTRVQYAESPVLEIGRPLTEVRMDASLNGDYRPLVLFINSLERDKMFFVITGVTLTGQQSGMVGLRLRLTTYLRQGGRPASGDTVAEPGSEAP